MNSLSKIVTGQVIWLLLVAALATSLQGQTTARVVTEENFRREPNGTQLATVLQGAELPVVDQQGGWVQVELSGWVWAPSLAATSREGFDLRVSADGGENLRLRPQGEVVARLLEGCLLARMDESGNWIQVRRRGWLWRASVEMSGSAAAEASSADPSGSDEPDEPPPVVTAPTALIVYATPAGDTIATFQPGAQAQVLGRTGDWIRIRVDGWVYGPAALDSALRLADTGDLTPAQLRADPARYRGALVRWRVQFVSLQRAESTRRDFQEGEPFILARGPAGDAGFVYLAVPEELLPVAESLRPLEFVTVVGRVRTGRSSQMGGPVIDLTDIEPEEPGGR
ncbi:MAG: hypothetical protein GWN99_11895 [Gemmatimonadetes bacterium]|uniref:SH3 domain-containing protein n=1 Tax=Candidatus Kutchimonas denitrificans TaxID=3056748 RepID=A0AAE5CDB2_9BACT|nr:hypothetical protein [Gemmatimonadota bacterium]NIR75434.1 hypothetical protein [Candidatus Kutchimonas denitrificans]NIS01748.1 hypothetical protein [Gemmatimonadota bacterium]NIT67530.1 hypothetical protein [Gemmatimonadota bacterium]NIU53393.1 hypothetical protein [Gemmatimonadota bacterium]